MLVFAFVAMLLALGAGSPAQQAVVAPRPIMGVLLLAHGGSAEWDANVKAIAAEVDRTMPTELALGMAARGEIQGAIDRLERRGVTAIVAVPLFVSSHSSVITSTAYLLGLRRDMPTALEHFAMMSHGQTGAVTEDGTKPVRALVPIRMTEALDAHPLLASILGSRAREMSTNPEREAVVLVAHGPTGDDENERWLVSLRSLGASLRSQGSFASVDAVTVRDDAPEPVRTVATRELRTLVERRAAEPRRVLIVPVLLSYGGIEAGIRTRLEGLDYVMSDKALAPDARLVDWVRSMAARR